MIVLQVIDGVVQGDIPADAAYIRQTATTCTVYQGNETPPPEPDSPASNVPQTVTALQFKLALVQADLYDAVTAAVAAAPLTTQLAFSAASSFDRSNQILASMAQQLGYTDAQIDAVFTLAATLT